MSVRRPLLGWPARTLAWSITLGTVMIVLLVVLAVGWVLLSVREALAHSPFSGLYWTMLFVGVAFLLLVLVGVCFYLVLSIKAINLNQRQSNFIDSVTHELKSPIASLKLYLQTLNRREMSEHQRADFYRFMLEDIERLDRLINHLLDAARIDQDPVHAGVEEVRLDLLLQNTAQSVCAQYRLPPETIRLELEPAFVRARPIDLEMIFRNLLDNAIKYAGEQPAVTAQLVKRTGRPVLVRITDNGVGIPPQWRRKIFGRFVRLGNELERHQQGTGLGLYIVDTLVRRLRGWIVVRGREVGSGTIFEVHLPESAGILLTDADAKPLAPEASLSAGPSGRDA